MEHVRAHSFWEDERMTFAAAMDLTAASLQGYGSRYMHWSIAFSGGKDSSATVTIVAHLIATGAIPTPESLPVLYADTRMELPPLQISALHMLEVLRERGIKTQIVL